MALLNLRHVRRAQTDASSECSLGQSLLLPGVANGGSEELERLGRTGWLRGRGALLRHILHPA